MQGKSGKDSKSKASNLLYIMLYQPFGGDSEQETRAWK